MKQVVLLARQDYDRLWSFLKTVQIESPYRSLSERLERVLTLAKPLPANMVPPETVTPNSHVTLREKETGAVLHFRLVFPWDSNFEHRKVSVLSSVGTEILGRSVGEEVTCHYRGKEMVFQIEGVDRK